MLGTFFILGTAATSHKKQYKLNLGVTALHEERRTSGQVLANSGMAAILSVLSLLSKDGDWVILAMVAGTFASATSDTFSSEFGNVYGRSFYNILTFKKDDRGLNGVVSLEGTLFGIAGSLAIALVYTIAKGITFESFVILISGVAGNLFDSLLGAFFERKGMLGNNAVNFLNTAFAAILTLLLLKS